MRVIIIGGGEVGFHIAEQLVEEEKKDVILIDNNQERVKQAMENFDIQVLQGSGSSPALLKEAGIASAEMVIAVTASDETNMIACLIAKADSPASVKIARVRNLEYYNLTSVLNRDILGIDLAINPERECAEYLHKLLLTPSAKGICDFADGKIRLVGFHVPGNCKLTGQELQHLTALQPSNGALVAAIERNERLIIPRGSTSLKPEDFIWISTTPDKVQEILGLFGKPTQPSKRIFISGGAQEGFLLAQLCEATNMEVKLLETDYDRCTELAQQLDKTVILHGDPLDQDLLYNENIEDVDAFIALSEDDDQNIVAGLLAKRMGVPKVITLLDKSIYANVVPVIGVDSVISKRMLAVNRILQFIRRGKVHSDTPLTENTEAIEFEALETSEIVGRPLSKLSMPEGSIVGGIVRRGQAIIPQGDTMIEPDDRVIIFAKKRVIPRIENLFTVKLNYF